ncbi:NupC/NupG family nucleoside CNT transporter [Roseospirillum parvum]|uniref:Concentrative nucleoside transporter, CNT family n=1 Tax=Roseospirillum parvum TaxID=83401 RepID=A0A1G7U7X2_9PROT|nr:nucleoside transporter C-terminal domain-containing protein [Roseospirillum parvum]SDG42840.1 concentrative nucleoside transporter, CNT family [Roseospirillum parvum]
MPPALHSALGLLALTALAWALGEKRHATGWKSAWPTAWPMVWRTAAVGLGLQALLAVVLLKAPGSQQVFVWLNGLVLALGDATRAGTGFVFGYLGGGQLPFEEPYPGAGFVLAFQALPIVLVMSALSAVLFYWRILPWVVHGFSWVLRRAFGIGGAVGVAAAANVFVGMVEAPLLVRPYLARLSRSELFMVMTVGMATIAGTVIVLYATFLGGHVDGALGHLLAASLISAPAGLMIARLMVPPDGSAPAETTDGPDPEFTMPPPEARSTMDAVVKGTANGLTLFLNIIAMLVVFVALVHLVDQMLALLPSVAGAELSLERLLGWIMAPVTWLIGIPWEQAQTAGALMGTKTILNELLAYLKLSQLPDGALDERSRLIMTYALCGFANFGSLGIMLGGLTAMMPERRAEIVGLGLKSIVSGTLATLMTGAMVGALTW